MLIIMKRVEIRFWKGLFVLIEIEAQIVDFDVTKRMYMTV